MLLTITTTHQPATDLGFLLHKHPDRVHEVSLAFGTATVVYPEATPARCTAALIVDVDPVGLIRDRRDGATEAVTLGQYVNDRPYAASSMLSAAIGRAFGTALGGRSRERPELTTTAIPLEVRIPALPSRGGAAVVRRLFEPLGHEVEVRTSLLDTEHPGWGQSPYLDVTFRSVAPLRDVLEHIYLLIPVLDNAKHYWVGEEEIDRLLRRGGTWLAAHPERELITTRALRYDRRLTRVALERLASIELEGADKDLDAEDELADEAEVAVEERISLNDQRLAAVVAALTETGARRVADLGCGEGRLVERLLKSSGGIEHVTGVDVSIRSLQRAAKRLHLDTMAPRQRSRVELRQGALTYRDRALTGVDAVTLVEVIEHVDPGRLDAVERAVFGGIAPRAVIMTTPNREYNQLFSGGPALRHRDHRFEWTRAEFEQWCARAAARWSYAVTHRPIGPVDPKLGPPTQMAIFTRGGSR